MITGLKIYETLNAGAVHRISVLNPQGSYVVIWTGQKHRIQSSRIFTPTLADCPFPVKVIKLELDCSLAGTWCEIDAVKLIGKVGYFSISNAYCIEKQQISLVNIRFSEINDMGTLQKT